MALALAMAVADPMESLIDGRTLSMFDGVVGESDGAVVIREDWGDILGVTEIRECLAQRNGLACVKE